jgi:hypothetical protein
MRYTKPFTILSLICALQAGSAVAADWSGLYLGVNQATKTVTGEWTTTETRDSLGFATEPGPDNKALLESEEKGDGLRIGLNGNPGNWVFGLEAVKESIRHEDSIDDRIPGLGEPSTGLLFYVTAGKAELDVAVTSTCSPDDNVCDEGTPAFTSGKTLSGTAKGLGLEYRLFGFLLRAEYQETDYGDFSFTALPHRLGSSNGADATLAVKSETMQFGLGYQF